jgi:two-component system nitrate/nitrite response regulator NarL
MNCDAFIKSIELVMMGGAVFPPAFLTSALDAEKREVEVDDAPAPNDDDRAVAIADDRLAQQLSPREVSIVHCLIEGDSNKCIARKIKIAEATVKVHIKAILRKIRVQNRTQAAIWGLNHRSAVWPKNDRSARAGQPAPFGAIEHAANYFEVSLTNGHVRTDMNSKIDEAIRLRK